MKRLALALVWVFAWTAIAAAQSTVYLPQVVLGISPPVAWTTAILVANGAPTGTAATTGTITFTSDNGSPMPIAPFLTDLSTLQPAGTSNTISFSISGGQTRYYIVLNGPPSGTFYKGFAKITSALPVTVSAVFLEENTSDGRGIAAAGVTAALPAARQAAAAINSNDTSIGLAYANPNATSATVTFQLTTTDGNNIGQPVTRTVPANTQAALFLNQLFPNLPNNFFGSVQITTDSSTPLTATTLLFADNGIFATLPIIPLQ